MARKPQGPGAAHRRPKAPRVTLTTKGLHTLIYFSDKLGYPDHVSPDGLVLAWPEAGAILILIPGRERCALRDAPDEAFFELLGWCAYHRVEVDLLTPKRFDGGLDRDTCAVDRPGAVTFTHLSPQDIDAFRDVVRGRGGLRISDREFHGEGGPGEDVGRWPETGILVVHEPVRERSTGGADPAARTATLRARNEDWLRTTAEALRTLGGSHGAGGRNVQ